MSKSLNVRLLILTFILLSIFMYLVNSIHLEKYVDVTLGEPIFEFSKEVWTTPSKNEYVQRYGNLNISQGRMTYSFWLDVRKMVPYWRNIFHVSTSDKIEYKPSKPSQLPYDREQDFTRMPAVFIQPNRVGIHICHDTLLSNNNAFDVFFSNPSHITLVWNAEGTAPSCTVYVNGQARSDAFYKYNSPLQTPQEDHFLYICDRFYGDNDFAIKDFKVFNYALAPEQVALLYQATPVNKVVLRASPSSNIKIRHPDGRV